MSQRRGSAYAGPMLLLILGLQSCSLWLLSSAATHTVGGSQGWDFGVDYSVWAAGQTFKVGDILFFPYSQAQHNVVVVDKAGYNDCSDANAAATFSEGNTSITLSSSGSHYYLCSVISHCSAGMKLAVTVAATTAATPSVAPTASPPAPTASPPASAPTTPPSPIKAPSTAPPSASTPSSSPSPSASSPAPTPSMEAPNSAPTPAPTSAPTPSSATASSPSAPGSSTSPSGTSVSSPPPPNAAPSLIASASIAPLLTLLAALFV